MQVVSRRLPNLDLLRVQVHFPNLAWAPSPKDVAELGAATASGVPPVSLSDMSQMKPQKSTRRKRRLTPLKGSSSEEKTNHLLRIARDVKLYQRQKQAKSLYDSERRTIGVCRHHLHLGGCVNFYLKIGSVVITAPPSAREQFLQLACTRPWDGQSQASRPAGGLPSPGDL